MIEVNCACHMSGCMRQLSAWIVGPRVVFLEPDAHADGTHTLVAGHMLEIVPNDFPRGSAFKIRAELVGARARFRDHAQFCPAREKHPHAAKPTRPTGVWDRGNR